MQRLLSIDFTVAAATMSSAALRHHLGVSSGVNPAGAPVLGSWTTNFFTCPGPHIGEPGLNVNKNIKCIIKIALTFSDQL